VQVESPDSQFIDDLIGVPVSGQVSTIVAQDDASLEVVADDAQHLGAELPQGGDPGANPPEA